MDYKGCSYLYFDDNKGFSSDFEMIINIKFLICIKIEIFRSFG